MSADEKTDQLSAVVPEERRLDDAYVMHTYGRLGVEFVSGHGATLVDVAGREYTDLLGGIGCSSLGHAHPAVVEALREQAGKLWQTSNYFYAEHRGELAAALSALLSTTTDEGGHEMGSTGTHWKTFFANSGAEANEGAIKLARKYSFDKYGQGRSKIITLWNSFHGRTVTTLKATGQTRFHDYFFPFTEGFDYAAAGDLDDLKSKITDSTCAVMMELIQGEGGVLPQDPAFVQAVAALCREKDLLLIIDEVQTGIGRTGSLFCFQQYGITPDIVTMAKGLGGGVPIGAVMAAKSCCDVLTPGTHATTFGGSPTVCAAANAVLSIVNDPDFLAQVCEKGEYLKNKILALGSPAIHGVRGKGLMLGIIVDEGQHSVFAQKLISQGVLVITAGKNAVRLLPPLTITYEELDEALAIMKTVFCN